VKFCLYEARFEAELIGMKVSHSFGSFVGY
jgi:hypothetical protein